ncbi:hypothetical protein MNBD_NITROSPINAE02-710 [hydrothermal vent metagenome]|uniref:Uncharacterized protein n=1 Tax=hydrothermal vent metagenome TaxID=652676 RepID=A0A3B1C7C1_9ZZZZ
MTFQTINVNNKGDSMKHVIRSMAVFAILIFASSCLKSEIVVKVKPDGSGEVVERVFMEQQYVEQMRMMAMAYAAKMKDSPFKGGSMGNIDIFDEKRLRQNASNMGEGVKLASVEKTRNDKGEGYKAIYTFPDINKLKMSLDTSDRINFNPAKKKNLNKSEMLSFRLVKGSPTTLSIITPAKKFGDKPLGANLPMGGGSTEGAENEMALNMMREMVKTMQISLALEPVGKIVGTNASYRTGSRITLMEIDFGKLTENRERFKKFLQANPKNTDEARELLKNIDGVKAELNDVVNIKFN